MVEKAKGNENVCNVAVEKALDETMRMCGVASREKVIERLKHCEPCEMGYFRFYLIRYVTECIISRIKGLRGIYIFGSTVCDSAGLTSDMNVLLHVNKKDKATGKLMDEVNGMLTEDYKAVLGLRPKDCFRLLDVHFITDKDVKAGTGMARLLSSAHDPPIALWRRKGGLCGLGDQECDAP